MGILAEILGGQNASLVKQIARSSGIGEADAQSVIGQLLPALTQGIKANVASPEGLGALVNALSKGDHQRYLEQPDVLAEPEAVDEGNAILGHVLGSREASRSVAEQAAETTGVSSSIVKQLLPLVATAVMGALSKETTANPLGGVGKLDVASLLGGDSSPVMGMISSFLDTDNDGDIADDILKMASKFF